MQVRKVAVVATGALATAAAMGSTPAFAADSAATPEVAPTTLGVLDYQAKHRASDEAMRQLAEHWLAVTPEQTWSAPWDAEAPQIVSVGDGSALSAGAWQHCGSNGPWAAGAVAPVDSPATVLGNCRNGNVHVMADDSDDAMFSILDGSAVSALAWQMCGSNGSGAAGANTAIASPATVTGNCDNGNITVHTSEVEDPGNGDNGNNGNNGDDTDPPADYPYEQPPAENPYEQPPAQNPYEQPPADYPYEQPPAESPYQVAPEVAAAEAADQVMATAPWDQEPDQILSAGTGSAVSTGAWQHCGSSGSWVAGATSPMSSPSTVLGKCRNGNIDITGDGTSDALFSVLDFSAASVASWQMCGSNGVGAGGVNAPMASPATTLGCDNGNVSVG
jgi:hypothetical protein